jgi:ParB family chromosome partitioning protein
MLNVNPSDLEVAANVRKDVRLSKQFVASVKRHGVLVPIIVTPGLDGYSVIDGQRRTLAAVDAGLTSVPVVVVDQPADEKDRVVTQVVVNDQRAGLTQADTVAAVQQLSLFGMSATAIARDLGEPKKAVDAAIKVGGSEAALAALREHELSLDDALLLVEFEDNPEALAALSEHLGEGYSVEHIAQRYRDAAAEAVVAAEIEALEGVELIESPGWEEIDPLRLANLYTDEALTVEVTPEVAEAYRGRGLCGYPASQWVDGARVWGVHYAIRGWKALGLFTHGYIENRNAKPSKPTTPEEIAAAKEERRVLRETTKLWRAASAVRVAWEQKILSRRVMPKGWDLFVAQHVISDHGYSSNEWNVYLALLGITEPGDGYGSRRIAVAEFLAANPHRAQAVALAGALAAVEGGFDFDRRGFQQEGIAKAHLSRLSGWGYELGDVEAGVLG